MQAISLYLFSIERMTLKITFLMKLASLNLNLNTLILHPMLSVWFALQICKYNSDKLFNIINKRKICDIKKRTWHFESVKSFFIFIYEWIHH